MTSQQIKISQLIEYLETLKDQFGDLPVKAPSGIRMEPPWKVSEHGVSAIIRGPDSYLLIEGTDP